MISGRTARYRASVKQDIQCILEARSMLLIGLFIVVVLSINLESVPSPSWDEGWTLSVARNWVELGQYGQLKDGILVSKRGLEAGFPVTSSIALSFWLFGTGILQARSMMVLYSLGTLAVLYYLASRLFDRKIALATLLIIMILAPHADTQMLLMGRQVLGEMPAMFYLLVGYTCLLWAAEKCSWFILGSMGFWSLALVTKAQVEPFWVASIVVALILASYYRNWKVTCLLGLGLLGSKIFSTAWLSLMRSFQFGSMEAVGGLAQTVAIVLTRQARVMVLHQIVGFGLPTLFGLTWAVWSYRSRGLRLTVPVDVIKLALLVLAGSWFAWYAVLSIGWPRYFFPAMLLSSGFVALMLCEWTDGFKLMSTLQRCGSALRNLQSLRALVAAMLIAVSVVQTGIILYGAFFVHRDESLMSAVQFLNTQTPPDARIETYETELFAFLERRYHYPPDQVHVDLIRKNSLGEAVNIDYDPLESDPDYLVLGRINKFWEFYDRIIKPTDFLLVQTFGRYQIYQRVRS